MSRGLPLTSNLLLDYHVKQYTQTNNTTYTLALVLRLSVNSIKELKELFFYKDFKSSNRELGSLVNWQLLKCFNELEVKKLVLVVPNLCL